MEEPAATATVRCPSIPARRRVRVVGKITDSSPHDHRSESPPASGKGIRVSVRKPEGESLKHSTVVFEGGRNGSRESYKLDWCYEDKEDVEKLFLEEVKPMIPGVFNGADASVIAFGAKGSGKTMLIEGCVDKPGLAPLAAAEILDQCKNGSYSVRISCYEIYQDRIYDILEQKEQEVQVLDDGHGRTQLRVLSQNHIESILDFNRLYFFSRKPRIAYQKAPYHHAIKSHKGLVLYICDGKSQADVGRLNFIDLAGYEDTTQKINSKPQVMESMRINKSLYALQNVICALNINERHVPYRGCKLTHMLKDSISGEKSQTLIIACLKSRPSQETIRAVCMASYFCMATFNSGKKNKSIPRSTLPHSPSGSWSQTSNTLSKKCGASRLSFLDKKQSATLSMVKGRNLFGMLSSATESVDKLNLEDKTSSDITFNVEVINQDKEKVGESSENFNCEKENCSSNPITNIRSIFSRMDQENDKDVKFKDTTPGKLEDCAGQVTHESISQEKTPPRSERLRDIANSLRALNHEPVAAVPSYDASKDSRESSETKAQGYLSNSHRGIYEESDMSMTPREIFQTRSSGLKRSLAQELLTYMNSATKEELMELKGIGEKRANHILDIRAESAHPFKDINDLKDIGLSSKQVKDMMKGILGDYYT